MNNVIDRDKRLSGSKLVLSVLTKVLSEHAMTDREMVKMIYNEAIDDAANFLSELSKSNPMQRTCLWAAEEMIRNLTLIEEDD
jgi:hypothetical protein